MLIFQFSVRKVELEVPQGSVQGPLLFVLYINNIATAIHHSTINLFADDTLLSVSGENLPDCIEKMNDALAGSIKMCEFQ
jgi:hypothetical protein